MIRIGLLLIPSLLKSSLKCGLQSWMKRGMLWSSLCATMLSVINYGSKSQVTLASLAFLKAWKPGSSHLGHWTNELDEFILSQFSCVLCSLYLFIYLLLISVFLFWCYVTLTLGIIICELGGSYKLIKINVLGTIWPVQCMQPRIRFAFLAVASNCWLKFSLWSTKIPHSFSIYY